MKKYKLAIRICNMLFWAWVAGIGFSSVMIFVSGRPIRSAGCVLISVGMALLFANLEVFARRQALLARDAEVAKTVYKTAKQNQLNDYYKAS